MMDREREEAGLDFWRPPNLAFLGGISLGMGTQGLVSGHEAVGA